MKDIRVISILEYILYILFEAPIINIAKLYFLTKMSIPVNNNIKGNEYIEITQINTETITRYWIVMKVCILIMFCNISNILCEYYFVHIKVINRMCTKIMYLRITNIINNFKHNLFFSGESAIVIALCVCVYKINQKMHNLYFFNYLKMCNNLIVYFNRKFWYI